MRTLAALAAVAALLAAFAWGLATNFHPSEPNPCGMTFMRPSYIPVPVAAARRPHWYELLLYREGQAPGLDSLDGIPVLFLPGNAGSHKQIRSLGATAARRAVGAPAALDFFTVSTAEELSAFHGQLLEDQTDFAAICVNRILGLYKGARRPSSVLLVGHSMGGVVARAIFLSPHHRPGTVHTIVTLATPHRAPPLAGEVAIIHFYDRVNAFWQREADTLGNVALVSIAGGFRDSLVRSELANLEGWNTTHPENVETYFSDAIPDVWITTDHQCIMWCSELVTALASALVALVDPDTLQILAPVADRMRIFSSHLASRAASQLAAADAAAAPATAAARSDDVTHVFRGAANLPTELVLPVVPQDATFVLYTTATAQVELRPGGQRLQPAGVGWDFDRRIGLLVLSRDELKDTEEIVVTTHRDAKPPRKVDLGRTHKASVFAKTASEQFLVCQLLADGVPTVVADAGLPFVGQSPPLELHGAALVRLSLPQFGNVHFPPGLQLAGEAQLPTTLVLATEPEERSVLLEGGRGTALLKTHLPPAAQSAGEGLVAYLLVDPAAKLRATVWWDLNGAVAQLVRFHHTVIISMATFVVMRVLLQQFLRASEVATLPQFPEFLPTSVYAIKRDLPLALGASAVLLVFAQDERVVLPVAYIVSSGLVLCLALAIHAVVVLLSVGLAPLSSLLRQPAGPRLFKVLGVGVGGSAAAYFGNGTAVWMAFMLMLLVSTAGSYLQRSRSDLCEDLFRLKHSWLVFYLILTTVVVAPFVVWVQHISLGSYRSYNTSLYVVVAMVWHIAIIISRASDKAYPTGSRMAWRCVLAGSAVYLFHGGTILVVYRVMHVMVFISALAVLSYIAEVLQERRMNNKVKRI